MKKLIKLEELGQFILAIVLFSQLNYAWWVFPLCILLPDLSMVGYALTPKTGAWVYNIFHHKLTAVFVWLLGQFVGSNVVTLAGIILFGHAAMDRILGYGLKFEDSFKHTHLGWIGQKH